MFRDLKQNLSSLHICFNKWRSIRYASVNMAFCSPVDNSFWFFLCKYMLHKIFVYNIDPVKSYLLFNLFYPLQITSISKLVYYHNLISTIDSLPYKFTAYKACPASYQKFFHTIPFFDDSIDIPVTLPCDRLFSYAPLWQTLYSSPSLAKRGEGRFYLLYISTDFQCLKSLL